VGPLVEIALKALVFHSPKTVRYENADDPVLEATTDAIVRVTSTAICGSDLHIYNGFFPQTRPMVLGHEFMGVVEEVGRDVKRLRPGDRVFVPFPIACGSCFFCTHEMPVHCETSNAERYGPDGGVLRQKGGGLFGYTDLYGGYQGGHAEYVRVPYADVGPRKVPEGFIDEQVLFLTDILPTGWAAIDWAAPRGGETVVVFGCGPVGLMAMKCAWLRGASRVIGVDRERYRLEMAAELAKAEVLHSEKDDVVEAVRSMTEGRGADIAVDAVGLEAHRTPLDKLSNVVHLQAGSIAALRGCINAVRRGGTVTVVGVYGLPYDNFPVGQMFDKGLTLRLGQAPVHNYIDLLTDFVVTGRIRTDDIITHRLPLEEGARAFHIFCRKEDNCMKVVLKP
jgi:S-(hydroxymethyl)glutathione dehydrogenase / alcohol dehydrogenase